MNRGERRKQGARGKKLPTIFMATVRPRSPEMIHGQFADSMLRLIAQASGTCGIRPVSVSTGPLLSRARNKLLSQFLEKDDEYILFADTDIIFEWDDLQYLLEQDKPICGSLYFTLDPREQPVIAHLLELEGEPETYRDVPIERAISEGGDPAEPFVVSGLGMGFTLIKREVIQALADAKGGIKKLWPFAETDEEKGYGEDLTFCLRAKELGFDSWLCPKSRVGHIKEIVL